MSDPSVEAAQRAWHANSDNDGGDPQLGFDDRRVWDTAVSAAREMAKSVQELHRPVTRTDYTDERWVECESCCGEWPCETAKRVYPSEELGL